ncbi:alpha/beta hydrolase [Arthrobacter sp. H5]|uniref:alpha/beta hydrolase n=1 Tax=Arthrobacter sp. H5 TaxID=1267973 RepID=UPI00048964FA|nr:alpha/beta hydrolase [Arthrobacter sp. H5]
MLPHLKPLLTGIVLAPLLLLGAAPLAQSAGPAAGSADGSQTVQREVSFEVQNVNRSKIPCEADGETYTVRGSITGPQHALDDPQAATLFLHGLSYGEFFGNYTEQPGYNFAQKQAAAGHVTVTVDRLGYDSSDKPDGTGICFGSRADIAHQIVTQLRSGEYQADDAAGAPAFEEVVLAGHSVGGIIAQAAAYSFGDIDALMVLSYSDTTVSPAAMGALETAIAACEAGGGISEGDPGSPGYVFFGTDTPEMFTMAHFFTQNADPVIVDTTAAMRNMDPCGDITSYMAAVETNKANIGSITTPTLVLIGGEDAIYPIQAEEQAALLTGVQDITSVTIPATGHAVTLHNTKDEFSAEVSAWLDSRGFGTSQMGQMPSGGADTGVAGTPAASNTNENAYEIITGIGVVTGALVLAAGAAFGISRRTANGPSNGSPTGGTDLS